MSPLVSVIIPIYNQEKWIGRCLRSLMNQSMSRDKYELIVIDDGSNDKSSYALELFKDEIKLIKLSKNKGLPAALNFGIRSAAGKYIVRVDSDDYVNENFLFLLYEFLEQNKYMDAVACDYLLINNKEEVIERKDCMEYPIGCGIMFKSNHLFEIGLYDEEFQLNEEKELRHRFEKKYQINRLELPLYRYRRHQNNITNDHEKLRDHDQKLQKKHGK
ncbi:MAG: glycosyl transferase [Candidatus Marinimicrobia bacterium]|nr:glycosyl transferase [Candidatus Neomarinimicrobiota bacterium]|tara:strand:- start:535 stop:1185 length:651 start_codon:yes stop_codon:yes gene_type:complete